MEFNNDTNPDPHAKISVGRQTSLSFMFGYNDSDWTHGWMAAFDGFTVFYSEPNEETIDPLYSAGIHGLEPLVGSTQVGNTTGPGSLIQCSVEFEFSSNALCETDYD